MGTHLEVIGPDGHASWGAAVAAVRRRFHREEARFSRFRGDSELVRVNRAAGGSIDVSREFAEVLRLSIAGAAASSGAFDPTVHDALVAAGYDRDLDEVLAGARGALFPAVPCGRWREISLSGERLRLPAGVHLDLSGIAKGWAADRAAEDAMNAGLPWVLVNAGGDLRIMGAAPRLEVAVEDPEDPSAEILRLGLASGGLATSSVTKRAWGADRHHVIDPRTGAPARTELLQATVWAPTVVEAEVLSIRALLEGSTAAASFPAALVTRTGDVLVSIPEEARA
jgi:thiamine biosynthesis lipoprotein